MLAWVIEAVQACPQLNRIVVATDSDEVMELCRQHRWPAQLTSPYLLSGTDRVHAVAQQIDADIYVNIQGDEPLLQPEHIATLLQPFARCDVHVTTLRTPCLEGDIGNPNAVKVVTDAGNRALYFSRAAIPYDRDHARPRYWKHIGLYAYRKAALDHFCTLTPGSLEQIERLEQLRFLENGISIHVEATEIDTVGVDTEDDLIRAEEILLKR